jgi:glycosyltransferase involved in cell wall biosynthesis
MDELLACSTQRGKTVSNALVSIIIPCYRQARFLSAAIQSVLAQSYQAIEMVVVNDGSDDDTEAVARSFDGEIRYHWQPNRGLSAARNAAISLSTGKYIHCLDADDRLAPEAIEWLVEASQCRDDVLCVMGARTFERDDLLAVGKEWLPPVGRHLEAKLLEINFGPPHMFLCSRSMLLAVGGFDTKMVFCEDWDLWHRLVFAGIEVVAVPRIGAFYRRHSGSMSRNRLRMAKFKAEVLRRALTWIANNPERAAAIAGSAGALSKTIQEKLAEELFDAGYILRNEGQYLAALRQYCDSIRSGGMNILALSGILKLMPHWVFCRARGTCPAPDLDYQNA